MAITSSGLYSSSSSSAESETKHTHILGYDTLIRFFNPKYYPKHSPPLSALEPYFDAGHALRAVLRPDGDGDVAEQRTWVERLGAGEMERDGGRREWAAAVEIVEVKEGEGISSTRVREAAGKQDWMTVERLCSERVARAIREEGLYHGED